MQSDPSSADAAARAGPGASPPAAAGSAHERDADRAAGPDHDAHLRLARRLDWRFLLPEPALGDVLLVGRSDSELEAALAARARSVRVLDPASRGDGLPERSADLAVIVGGVPASVLRRVQQALRPGGWIVAEVRGIAGWRPSQVRGAALGEPHRMARRLGAVTRSPVAAWLAVPSHGSATALLPADDPAALAAYARRRLGSLGPIAAPIATAAARLGLATPLGPASILLARTPPAAGAPGALPGEDRLAARSWLAACIDAASASRRPEGRTQGARLVVLTPRFRASAHVVALATLPGAPGPGPHVVLKAARLVGGGRDLAAEAEALRRVEASLGAAGAAPVLLGSDQHGDPAYLVETGLVGPALDPAAVRRDPARAARAIAQLAARIPPGSVDGAADPRVQTVGRLVGPALAIVRERAGASLRDLVEATERTLEPDMDGLLPVVVEHGDLAHPNLIRVGDGMLGAVDWERSRPDGLPLHDLVTGLAYVTAAARGATRPVDIATAFRAAVEGPDPWIRDVIDAELGRLGIRPDLRGALLLAPWLRAAAWLAERTDPAWLATDRSVALWRAMLDGPARR